MSRYPRLFRSQAIMLCAVAIPLSIAEDSLLRCFLVVGIVAAAAVSFAWRKRPVLPVQLGRSLVVAAFAWLVIEYTWLDTIPVVALSHFMVSFCVIKLLQIQTDRERVQVLVLCFLLLVVAAIISSDVVFLIVLLLYLTVGLRALMSLHMAVEHGRVEKYNRRVSPFIASTGTAPTDGDVKRPVMDVTFLGAMTAVAVGIAVFVLSPRAGVGMFGALNSRTAGLTMTGLGPSLNFDRIGRIQTSDEEVGTVVLRDEHHQEYECQEPGPYFRGMVFDQYFRSSGRRRGGWEWRKSGDRVASLRDQNILLGAEQAGLFSSSEFEGVPRIVQDFRMHTSDSHVLLAMYPAVEVRSKDFDSLRKNNEDQVLWIQGGYHGAVHYEVVSLAGMNEEVVKALARVRGRSEPTVQFPDPPLPREVEIRNLVAEISDSVKAPGTVDDPEWRRLYAEQVCKYLSSSDFVYSLDRPPRTDGGDPVSAFLLDHKRGHCEYFAAAMTILCQYRGIPTRVVTGYRGGDYNSLGRYYVLRQKHAHSWVEVFVPGSDWVLYDPTPAGSQAADGGRTWLSGLISWRDYLQFEWSNLVVSYDSGTRARLMQGFTEWLKRPAGERKSIIESVGAFVRELFWWKAELGLYNRLLYWFFAIMALVLLGLVSYVVGVLGLWTVRYWWARHQAAIRRDAVIGEVEFYRRFRRRLRTLGLQRPAGQTPAEFAVDLARRYPALSEAPSVVSAYYRIAFGGGGLSPSEKSHIDAFLRRLRALNRGQLEVVS